MFKVNDIVQILPEFQDDGDDQYERIVTEILCEERVRIMTKIPYLSIQPTEVIETRMIKLYESNR